MARKLPLGGFGGAVSNKEEISAAITDLVLIGVLSYLSEPSIDLSVFRREKRNCPEVRVDLGSKSKDAGSKEELSRLPLGTRPWTLGFR